MIGVDVVRGRFARFFGFDADVVVTSPGRTNLMGDHTDYNGGLVLPIAIDRGTTLAARATKSGRVRAVSEAQHASLDVPLVGPELAARTPHDWGAYVRGPIALLRASGVALEGLELFIDGDLPLGAGLSSSASLEVAVARAVLRLAAVDASDVEVARLCQRAEHELAGVRCGIMDQLVVAAGVAGCALRIDCRDEEHLAPVSVAISQALQVVVCDTRALRSLAGSAYNERRATCEGLAKKLHVSSLRDVDDARADALLRDDVDGASDEELRCARHVIRENARVDGVAAALASGDGEAAGALLRASHASLRDDYRVSSQALDAMVDAACADPTVFGARLTGAGFGGCVVALADARFSDENANDIAVRYRDATGTMPSIFVVRPSAGAAAH